MNAPMDLPNQIVTVSNGLAVTTSLAIAQGTDNDHASVIKLVRNYLADLEEFGRVGFEIAPFETAGGAQKREVAILNEQQSTLLLTYMRNSDIVRRFKKALVKAFFELAQQAKHLPELPTPRIWNGQRANNLKSRWRWVLTAKRTSGERYAKTAADALDFFDRFFGYVAASDFLTGRDGKWQGCDLGWLVKADNFSKVFEGKYQNREAA